MSNGAGSAALLREGGVSWNYRYQYLAGGVNTGQGWTTWNANAEFASFYIKESAENGLVPVFTYYQLLQSKPARGGGEDERDFNNLNNQDTMRAYYNEFRLLLEKAAATNQTVIIHVEPDLAGYMQQRVVDSTNSAASITASVADTGLSDLKGLPNTYQGFNQALLRLRDRYAPKVLLATHASAWSTKVDVSTSTDPNLDVASAGRKTAEFLGTAGIDASEVGVGRFDLIFVDASDRDAGFHQIINGDGGAHWWDDKNLKRPNFTTFNAYLQALTSRAGRKAFLWQVPIGNTIMRTENNAWNHFQDNRVQYWLGGYPTDYHLASLARSGVAAILWGRGADGNSSAEDAAQDGITNPPAINGNNRVAVSADDDGGYLKERMLAYQKSGQLQINDLGGSPAKAPPSSATPVKTTPTAGSNVNTTTEVAASSPSNAAATLKIVVNIVKPGPYRIAFKASTDANAATVRVDVDGATIGAALSVPKRTAKKQQVTLTTTSAYMSKGRHSIAIVNVAGTTKVSGARVIYCATCPTSKAP